MSGPLARSAHMRMKMKREKNGPTTPRAPLSPAAVNKDLLLAAAVASTATLSSEVSEKEVEAVPQNNLPSRSLSSPVAVRSRSRSRSRPRVRGGINSLDTEGDYVVESASPAAPSPRTREVPLQRQSSPSNSFAKNSFGFDNVSSPRQQQPTLSGSVANNPISPTHPRSIFNSSSPRHFSARSRKSYDFPPSPSHQQFDVAEVQSLRNTQREQMENVRKYNEETVEMHDRRKEQLSPGSRVSVEEEAFDPFAPSPLTVPVEKEDFQDAFDDGFTSAVTPAPGGAGFHSSPHYSKSPQLIIDTQSPPYDNDPTADVYSPNHKDGSKMMTIEGHDDNFVYPESYEDHPDADLEYHTNDDEEPVNLNDSIDATIDSNGAVEGTPVRKKRKKKKKPKFMIENVHSADSFDKKRSTEGRYAIHNNSWEEDEENLEPRDVSKVRGHSVKYNKIAATAKRYEGMEDRREKVALSPIAGDGRKVVMPSRIGVSRSWDSSKVEEVPPVVSSKSWDAPSDNGSHGWRNVTKKQLNIWNDDYVEEGEVEKSPSRQKQFVGATKSWDVNGVQKNTEQSHGNSQDMNFFHADPFGHAPIEGNANVGVKDAFASWDGDGPEWKDPNEETEEVASDKATETNPKREIDWNKKGTENIQNMIPAEFETPNVSEQVSDYEEDEDSIFAFEKKEEEIKETAPPPPPANPQDIFAKLNKGLKQAERNKSHALRGDASLSNAGSDFSKDASEPASETSKPAEKRNVAFAKDKDNTIHTYLVEESHFDSRDSASHVESTDDEVETDIESSVDKEEEENITTSPKNQVKISSPRSISSKNNTGSSNDGAAAPNENQTTFKKKTVHYQSDEDTSYHTNEESTMGSSFKSNRSGVTPEQEEEKELNLLDHVAGLAASLGGLFTSPTNAAASKTDDDKSLSASTDQDDNTYGQSTLPSQDNTTQSDDWFGYMEKVLFPTNDEAYPDAERSVHTESEHTESQYTASNYSESQARSSKYTMDDSDVDEDEEDDEYLLQQALASARAVHHLHGVEYDETQEIDVVNDVKFHVANIKLPLGLLFQEHEIGAWVSRVVPEGNGVRKGVQHGDQLTSINGKSAVHASIDEVAATISRTPTGKSVELSFLRYVGPLRPVPGAIIQEGFEVTDSSVNKKMPPRPPKTKPPSPSKSKSRFFAKSPPSSPKASSGPASPARSPSSKQTPSPSESDATNGDVEAGDSNSRSIQKKKIKALGKMMSFKKSRK